jgi:hypothetical protein
MKKLGALQKMISGKETENEVLRGTEELVEELEKTYINFKQ